MPNNKRTWKQNRINNAQKRLDRDIARSERDKKRNRIENLKKKVLTFFIIIFILFLIMLYLQK